MGGCVDCGDSEEDGGWMGDVDSGESALPAEGWIGEGAEDVIERVDARWAQSFRPPLVGGSHMPPVRRSFSTTALESNDHRPCSPLRPI